MERNSWLHFSLNYKEILESMSVAIVMLLVLLPLRIVIVRYLSDNWFGSFGVITIVSITILLLAKKDKLGWFGRAFTRQMFKIHRGKRRYFAYTSLGFSLIFLGFTIYAIELGNTIYTVETQEVKDALPVNNMQDLAKMSSEGIRVKDLPAAFFLFFYIMIFRFDIFAVLMATMNDLTNQYVMHFSTVFFVETLELAGILIYTRIALKKPNYFK